MSATSSSALFISACRLEDGSIPWTCWTRFQAQPTEFCCDKTSTSHCSFFSWLLTTCDRVPCLWSPHKDRTGLWGHRCWLWSNAAMLEIRLAAGWALQPDEISYTAAISACDQKGKWLSVLRLLHGMDHLWAAPNQICSSDATAAGLAGFFTGASEQSPTKQNANARSQGLNAAISAFQSGYQWHLAVEQLFVMSDHKHFPDEQLGRCMFPFSTDPLTCPLWLKAMAIFCCGGLLWAGSRHPEIKSPIF